MNLEELQRTMGAAVMQPLTADEEMQPRDQTGRWNGRGNGGLISLPVRTEVAA